MELVFGDYGIEQPYLLLLIIPTMFALHHYIKKGGMNKGKWFFLFTRLVIVSIIAIALTSPFTSTITEEFKDLTSITILFDQSESMTVTDIDKDLADKIYDDISSAIGNLTGNRGAVEQKHFSEGNRTEIGNALYKETLGKSKEKNLIVLLSDCNNNYGRDASDMAQVLAEANITVYAVIPNTIQKDVYISEMTGDKKTPANADYTLKIGVGKAGSDVSEYNLLLKVDDNLIHMVNNVVQVEDTKSFRFTFSMKDEGVHKITAEIKPKGEDLFRINNEMIKSVDVVERPDVLLVTENHNSLLSTLLNENYDVFRTTLPRQDYSKYDVVYFDNVPVERMDDWVINSLNNYVVEGNGLVVVGGEKAYERGDYHNSQIETLLPVISTEPPEKKRKEIAVIFLIDISESTSYGMTGETKVDVEKALAINMLRQLDLDDMVGVIAFNVKAYTVSPLKKIEDVELELETRIRSLTFTGGTDMMEALLQAETLFGDFEGKKYVILISDGVIQRLSREETTLQHVKSMNDKGITVYTVGVGFDTNERFMRALADTGKGIYFRPEDYERLHIEFEEKEKVEKDQYTLGVYNKYHFITRDLTQFWPAIKDFNGVTEKSVAQVLVTTEGKMPVVTVWRFGLGRVVSLTVDNGLQWAPNLYYSNNGELISAITNWAIGNLEKRKRVNIETMDVNIGGKAEIQIKSEKEPDVVIQDWEGNKEEIELKQTDVDLFAGSFTPQKSGFYMMKAVSSLGEDTDAIAVDMPLEYRKLGVDTEELKTITAITQGRVYDSSEIGKLEADVLEYIRESSSSKTLEKTPLHTYFMAAALGLFFLDVVSRRILDIIRLRRKGE
ncbi:MAG: VWA domain-containing protein [Candidatus Altiarchaeota archaeon]|nr:VWA domain-containing protein [Candidatus Altiarchaeota archaeon]